MVAVVRLHFLEDLVIRHQLQWVCGLFNFDDAFCQGARAKYNSQSMTTGQVANALSNHLEELVEDPKLSAGERLLLCQMTMDLESPLIHRDHTLCYSDVYDLESHFFLQKRNYVDRPIHLGDYGGALIMSQQRSIGWRWAQVLDFNSLISIGSKFRRRLPGSLRALGVSLAPAQEEYFGNIDVLTFPFTLLSRDLSGLLNSDNFLQWSLMWLWTRRAFWAYQFETNDSKRPYLSFEPFFTKQVTHCIPRMEHYDVTDAFGFSSLHAVVFSQRAGFMRNLAGQMERWEPSKRSHITTLSPSYAPGCTALSCAALLAAKAEPRGGEPLDVFFDVLAISGTKICSIQDKTDHRYCPLGIGSTLKEKSEAWEEIVTSLLTKARESNQDIVRCLQWMKEKGGDKIQSILFKNGLNEVPFNGDFNTTIS